MKQKFLFGRGREREYDWGRGRGKREKRISGRFHAQHGAQQLVQFYNIEITT